MGHWWRALHDWGHRSRITQSYSVHFSHSFFFKSNFYDFKKKLTSVVWLHMHMSTLYICLFTHFPGLERNDKVLMYQRHLTFYHSRQAITTAFTNSVKKSYETSKIKKRTNDTCYICFQKLLFHMVRSRQNISILVNTGAKNGIIQINRRLNMNKYESESWETFLV